MSEQLLSGLVQLGAAVVIVAFMWLIISAIVKFAGSNDKDSSATINTLTNLLATFSNNLSKNTEVLIELKTYMSKANEETATVFNRIEASLARNYSSHSEEIKALRVIVEEVRQSMDKTIPINIEGLDDITDL